MTIQEFKDMMQEKADNIFEALPRLREEIRNEPYRIMKTRLNLYEELIDILKDVK